MGPKALVPKLERAYWELQNPQMARGGPNVPPDVAQKYGGMGYKNRGQKWNGHQAPIHLRVKASCLEKAWEKE